MAVRHDDAVRAAVIAACLAGQSVTQVAKEHGLPVGTVKSWMSRARAGSGLTVGEDRSMTIGDLVFDNLEAMLAAQTEIVRSVSKDAEWLRNQTASELGIFLGILSDKSFRIIEALPEPEDAEGA